MTRQSSINLLHILNDGFNASLLLLLPFIAREMKIDLTNVGILGSTVNMLQIFLALPAGYLASKIGGFRLLVIALLVYALAFLISSFSTGYLLVAAAFFTGGVGFALFHPVAFAVVTKIAGRHERGKALGNFTALGDLGRIGVSSLITFVITYVGWRSAALSCFAVLALVFIFYLRLLRQPEQAAVEKHEEKDATTYTDLLRNRRFIFAVASFFADTLASSSLFVFIPFLLLKRGVSPAFLGVLTSTFFVGNMLGKTTLGRLVDRFGNTKVFILSELAMAVFIVILSGSTLLPVIILSSIVLGIFTKGTVPILTTMVSESVEHHGRFEKAFGVNALITGIASTLAPSILGFLSDRYGISHAFSFSAFLAVAATVPAIAFSRTAHQTKTSS